MDENDDAREVLNEVHNAGKRRMLHLNAKKTKCMSVGMEPARISIDGQEINNVTQFKYLGSIKKNKGDCSTDIKFRIALAKKRMQELVSLWKDRRLCKK